MTFKHGDETKFLTSMSSQPDKGEHNCKHNYQKKKTDT